MYQVDTMIVQAIGLLDDLDKELNTYAMRVREWYGWHFPEMSKIVTDNVLYARTVRPGNYNSAHGKFACPSHFASIYRAIGVAGLKLRDTCCLCSVISIRCLTWDLNAP